MEEAPEGKPASTRPGKSAKATKTSDWELDPNELDIVGVLGRGSTSQVFSAVWRGSTVAVKEVDVCDESTLLAVKRELQVMTRVDHPHVLRLVGLCSSSYPLRLVLEFCAGGTLFDLLHNCWDIPLNWTQRLQILLDISSGMAYLHGFRKQVIHRDLKSLNIFLLAPVEGSETVPDIRIADFGFARFRERAAGGRLVEWTTPTRAAGSMHWMAPEVYSGTNYHSKADVFSFAIVIYEVICRHMAFEDMDADQAGEVIARGDRPVEQEAPADTPEELRLLMMECWDQDPEARPTFSEIEERLLQIQADYLERIAVGETSACC